MNLFEMERNLNSSLKTKQLEINNKLANARNNLLESQNQEMLIREHDFLENQKNMISEAGNALVSNRSTARRRMLAERCKFETALKKKLFTESVYDIFMESLLIDDNFKETYAGNLYELVESTLDKFMTERNITLETLKENSSFHIQNIIALCESTAKKEADAKYNLDKTNKKQEVLNEKEEDDKEITLSDTNKGDFDDEKEFETKSISDAVKEKVVSVVRTEMEMAQLEQAESEDINYEIQPEDEEEFDDEDNDYEDEEFDEVDDTFSEGISVKEFFKKYTKEKMDRKIEKSNTKITTYTREIEKLEYILKHFDRLWDPDTYAAKIVDKEEIRKSFQKRLAKFKAKDQKEKEKLEKNKNKLKSMSESLLFRQIRRPGILQESLFKSLQMNIANKMMQSSVMSESTNVELDMDLVLAESLSYYTLLETLHTSRIVEFKASELRSMAKSLINEKE